MTTRRKNKPAIIQYQESLDINTLNKDFPVKIKTLDPVIDNIAKQYPSLKRSEIVLIIKIFWEEIREQLIMGNTINIAKFLQKTHLYPYYKIKHEKVQINMRLRTTTPIKLRYV